LKNKKRQRIIIVGKLNILIGSRYIEMLIKRNPALSSDIEMLFNEMGIALSFA
jgi:uncharacterized protein YneF (UPF0154 family)